MDYSGQRGRDGVGRLEEGKEEEGGWRKKFTELNEKNS